jgi:CCR4-NOT transcription complex subunit 6
LAYKQPLNRLSFSGEKEDDDVSEYTHAFKLSSAYSTEVMPFTDYTFEFKGVIDYIFYSRPNTSPLGLLGPLDQSYLTENKIVGAPHASIPSGKCS